jgi:two-component system phosphate regulon sensor histidine kinase PhoR
VEEILDQCRKMGASQTITLEIMAPKMYLQVTATPLGPAQPGNTLLLLQNLTRIRRLETVRQDFISNISHELRTPLAALKAIVETLQEGALDDPPAAGRFLQRMETELDALSQMVEELLELSRIESGRVPLKLESIQPGDLIQQAVQRLSLQAERAGLSVETHVVRNLPLVKADPARMVQVIVNLLHNAIKFTPPGGFIRISAESQKHTVLFSIQDSGVGIPQGDLPRIFERFYKTDRARSSGGTGLGLAISRHLIEAHGGAIWAESKEQSGSTFFFTLPAAD